MSEDGFPDNFDEPNMEIQIRTLMGTSFDMKVVSTDTIGDIKKKIYRVEGIPIFQQNLIFQSKELKDSNRLCDAGISSGSKLTLVVSMRGGPISTRRLSVACDHHVMFKELKELLENTRDEIGEKLAPGSKVSVLVFKEGDIINLLRVIENEDGSYSPYSEKPISPPPKPPRKDSQLGIYERFVEDNDMSSKIANLRKKMEDLNVRRQLRTSTTTTKLKDNKISISNNHSTSPLTDNSKLEGASSLSDNLTEFFSETGEIMGNVDLTIFEKTFEEENHSETEEIALKDKHRTKTLFSKNKKSLYSESKGAFSHARQNYARIHKKTRELRGAAAGGERLTSNDSPASVKSTSSVIMPFASKTDRTSKDITPALAEQLAVLENDDQELPLPFSTESLSMPANKRLHLTRLVLSESTERPKSTPDSLELEENADLWEIHEPASERLKHSATTCKVGLLKRRQSLDYGFEGLENASKPEIGNYCKNSEFEVCSENFYHHMPFVSSPSAIPPQYAPKDQNLCDIYFSENARSPLYGRKSKNEGDMGSSLKREEKGLPILPEIKNDKYSFLSDCSSIQRLKNDCTENSFGDSLFSGEEGVDSLYGYYNLGTEFFGEKVEQSKSERKQFELPPVMKKKARCSECNKRLNITNIYDCRCGKIFCSQHRYSEVHRCSYDYKNEGRRILEQQNPLVTAEKVHRI